MRFDTIITAPCVNPNAVPVSATDPCGVGAGGDGVTNVPIVCADPAYAAAHPGECLVAPRLIVKPQYAIREVGKSVLYKAFLWVNGTETEVTATWQVSNPSVAVIGTSSGNATGLLAGIVTVSATYGILNGFAQLEVIAAEGCALEGNTFVLLIDNSESSSQPFSGTYSTRLAFAKEAARNFLATIDFTKDKAAVLSFNSAGDTIAEEGATLATLQAAVDAIAQTILSTDIQQGLEAAYNLTVTGRRVIVLFSDGEHETGEDPVDYAESIRSVACIIFGIGLRASGYGFQRMNRIANGGFFLNALPTNQGDIAGYLAGLKSYICSGNCAPAGDAFVGVGQLNFTNFISWDVIAGHVDLIGKNTGGTEFYDFELGNGLYVDGCGSTASAPAPGDLGTIRTKNVISIIGGNEHTVTIKIAGNKREDRTPDVTRVIVYDQTGTQIATQDFSVTDWQQAFTTYTLTFTPDGGVTGVKIVVQQLSIATGGIGVYGSLWDVVTLTDITAGNVVKFTDNFDADNPTYIIPGCGESVLYPGVYYGYACYAYGCLDAPIPAQIPDPSPLSDIEA